MNRIFKLLVVCCLGSMLGSCDVVVKRMDAKIADTKQEVVQSAPETYESIEFTIC